jgi:transglutaminase-like putative cysteine protease
MVELDPGADEMHEHVDYYGNRSTYFRLSTPHRSLSVTARSRVEVERDPVAWEAMNVSHLGAVGDDDLLAQELRLPSPLVPRLPAVTAYAATVLAPGQALGTALPRLLEAIAEDFTYKAGSTTVSTPLETLLTQRTGVCQDFAHLMIGCLRSVGLPARYVSGYLQTLPPPGKPRLVGADASHAWVSVHIPSLGWVDLDPTNCQRADQRYIVVARGRDYADVPPLKGVIFTRSTKSTMAVSVDVEPWVDDQAGVEGGLHAGLQL